jgi:gliding motility-associated protein GldM
MAGGKLTPRQKMINLMYLVFIAMLALNMSKEVLTAFGLMNEKFETANTNQSQSNQGLLGQLETKASDEPDRFAAPFQKANQAKKISDDFYNYLGTLSKGIESGFEKENGKLPFEAMDKSTIDELWFQGDGYSPKGKEIVAAFDKYKADLKALLGEGATFQPLLKEVETKFSTADVKDGEGVNKKYLDYHFKGFPAIATMAKLTALQNDVKNIEAGVYNVLLGNTLKAAASFKNYNAIVIPDKSAFFAGEQFKGKVVLGRYDKSTVPTKVVVNGVEQDLSKNLVDGQVMLSFNTGNVGEHEITGKFTFMEEGKEVPIDIKGNYVVVPKPNSANISADKMNVVYRGVVNPMTISFAGISDDKVTANAPGLVKGAKAGQFNMSPGQGREVTINVTGKLPDGQTVADKKTFRIKDIPAPQGKVRKEVAAKGSKSNLEISSITAELEDFDFELGINVVSFNIRVPGQPTVVVSGSKMDEKAKTAIRKAARGDVVVISEIKTKLANGSNLMLKKTSPCTFEIQ